MEEKNISIEDAFQVWWFMAWRTGFTLILISVFINGFIKITGINAYSLDNTITLIASILFQVFFVKRAINRSYKNFRLSSLNNIQNEK